MATMNQQKVSTEDILRSDVQRTGGDFDEIYAALEQGIHEGKTRILRHNNTLLIYNIIEKGVAEIHIATVDQPPAMIDAFKSFYHAAKVAGFKSLHSEVEDPQIIRLIQMAKIPVQAHQSQGGYQITIEVK
jgi:hypothetical protein